MDQLSFVVTLLRLSRAITGAFLDPSALTCFVCTSIEFKDCGDPMLPDKEENIPYFECKRLFGVFDDVSAQYVHFRPTRHGYVAVKPTVDIERRVISKSTPMKEISGLSLANQSGTPVNRPICNRLQSSPSCWLKTKWRNLFDLGEMFGNLFYKGTKRARNIQKHSEEDQTPVFSPYHTQGGPKGLEEKPNHYCYKVKITDGKHGEVIERGCTNVTTKHQACKSFYNQPNVTECEYCGLNFCNGINGLTCFGYSGSLELGMITILSIVVADKP